RESRAPRRIINRIANKILLRVIWGLPSKHFLSGF
ncbi:MAG: hypothetical protein ACI8QF_001155, partial [Limisphaerales bacterium]